MKRLVRDPRVPRRAKVALALLVPYLASPIDLIPDFLPGIGQLDDVLLVAAALRYIVRVAGRDVVAEHWPGTSDGLNLVLRAAAAPEQLPAETPP